MTAGAMGLYHMTVCRLGGMQRMRRIQCRRASGASQNQSECPNARQLHPVNILSTMDYVPCIGPWAAHFVPIGHSAGRFMSLPRIELFIPDASTCRM
jgi:hypothetical protein